MKEANCKLKTMKIILYTALVFIGALGVAMGQVGAAFEKIENARIALITDRLELSPEQGERFWPIYREYSLHREDLRREFMQARLKVNRRQLSEAESQQLLTLGLEIKEREVALDRKYNELLATVISSRQLLELRKAEQDFRRMLMERLQRRQDGYQPRVSPEEERLRQRFRENNN